MRQLIPDDQWITFARTTVKTGDLDPMYDFIYNANTHMGIEWAETFALHFFLFYHAGEAIKAASHRGNFWEYVKDTYNVCKRGTERRHFRGENGRRAIEVLSALGGPDDVWRHIYKPDYGDMVKHISANFVGAQIGPYFMWKAMDIFDRGLGAPVALSLSQAARFMPSEPLNCAAQVWPQRPIAESLEAVKNAIADLPAQGAPGRNCGYAEAETILCMIKGFFLTRTHTIGDDIAEKHEQLKDYPELLQFLPAKLSDSEVSSYVKAVGAA